MEPLSDLLQDITNQSTVLMTQVQENCNKRIPDWTREKVVIADHFVHTTHDSPSCIRVKNSLQELDTRIELAISDTAEASEIVSKMSDVKTFKDATARLKSCHGKP